MRWRAIGGRARLLLPTAACVLALAGCGSEAVDAGGLTAGDRGAAQRAVDALAGTNIPLQLVAITRWVQNAPAACRIRLVSREPRTYEVYVFWIPWLAAQPYVWLTGTLTDDPQASSFHLGTADTALPGGRLNKDGRTVNRLSVDTTLLSRYGPQQARKSRQLLQAKGGDVFAEPGARCQLLENGSLRLLPA